MESIKRESTLLDRMNFGTVIRRLREDQGLKAYELAEKIQVHPVYITQIEKHNKPPSIFVMKKISEALHHPSLLELYVKVKCSAFYDSAKVKSASGHETQGINGASIKEKDLTPKINKEYLLELEAGDGITKQIFGNDLIYHGIYVSFKNTIEGIDRNSKISTVGKLGIVIVTYGPCEEEKPPILGFHNYFVPWSEINYMYQYLEKT